MRRKWIGWAAVLAAAAFLIPLSPWFTARAPVAPQPNAQINRPSGIKPLTAAQEHHMKISTVRQDMDATAKLCATECARNLHKLMLQGNSSKEKKEKLQHMMDMHKQMIYVNWVHNGQKISRGKLPSGSHAQASMQNYLKQGAAAIESGQNYTSPPIKANGRLYLVVAVPDERRKGDGISGVLLQDVVNQVERHQKRNLRLVPYPAEGHYKIESVKPNSTTDITVRNGEDNGNASHYHVNEVVVKFNRQPSDSELEQIRHDISALSIRKLGSTYIFRSKEMEARPLINYFNKTWQPQYVEPHYLYLTNDASIVPNDALYSKYQWNLPVIETEKGWNLTKGSEKVIIAVLDTGVQADHPDLSGKLMTGTNIVDDSMAPDDDVGHGTHVAGIIAASVNNGEGVAGLSWYNKVLPVKVLDSSGAGSTYSVAEGIIWATDHGAKVINMSLGNYAQAEFLHDAIKYAYDHDVVLVAASGNDNTERPGFPAAYPEVFAVASTDADGSKSSFSNYGDYIDVAAPGASIASTYPGSQYAALSGTSMASPHVAALAGLIRSINPDLSNEEVMKIMRTSAQDLGDKGKDNYFGYGQIDVVRALEKARQSAVSLQQFPQQVERRLAQIASKYK
ncbi:S8 family peptidase [Paenibacillus oenotherae]|uniref:S8 family peptidase n=1 Tax=Paenibacillus oenotherae TaxID=1435645 RepID=A0ABS7D165_9BACL|nr:S8 family peptidase [Paenibacillus oenotherae]MBW7473687.1 S8 family peptidase [Paenibacillus oenotherae]